MKKLLSIAFICSLASAPALAAHHEKEDHASHGHAAAGGDEKKQIREMLQNLVKDNEAFVKEKNAAYFNAFAEKQTPRATVVTCSDSRIHNHAIDKTPDNDLFIVRNIGNQHASGEGSIEYGVRHLNTPVLLFVGHTACGAVKAAMSDYAGLEPAIKKELDTMHLEKKEVSGTTDPDWLDGVVDNVNDQVKDALAKYADMAASGKLLIIGAVYDFRNDMKQGQGKLVITNYQGETDAVKIKAALKIAMD